MSASQTIPSLHKAIAVLERIGRSPEPVSVKELTHDLKIPPASCYRIVRTLLAHDFLREEPEGGLRIGFGVAKVARAYSEIERALRNVRAPLRDLAEQLRLAAKISLREGEGAVTVLRAEPPSPNAITSPVGRHIHLAQGGSAAVALLSLLPDAEVEGILASAPEDAWSRQKPQDVLAAVRTFRRTGLACNFGMQHPSIHAMSVLLRLGPNVQAAVSVVGWPEDFSKAKQKALADALRGSVARMQRLNP